MKVPVGGVVGCRLDDVVGTRGADHIDNVLTHEQTRRNGDRDTADSIVRGDASVDRTIAALEPPGRLHVRGDIDVTGDVFLAGADCAEDFDVAGADVIEPGTVVVIGDDETIRPSDTPL